MIIENSITVENPVPNTTPKYVHLRVHSSYSLLEGALPIAKLARLSVKNGFPAIALTDRNNLFGILEFSYKLAEEGIQPIAGLTLCIDFADQHLDQRTSAARPLTYPSIALLAMSGLGYVNLMKLSSYAFFDPLEHQPTHVHIDRLVDHKEGLIVLTGGPDGPINEKLRVADNRKATERLLKLTDIFRDCLYVEIQRHNLIDENLVEPHLLNLAYDHELPIVATNQCYFEKREDYEAHDALICIADGRYIVEEDRRRLTPEHSFKSEPDMIKLFSDLPEALDNTIEIAQRCHYRPLGRPPILPKYISVKIDTSTNEQISLEARELSLQAIDGLNKRLANSPIASGFNRKDYYERLEFELDIITRMKFPGYFLIVSDFIKWSKENNIPVGPGRGSGAGSLVAWSLTITELDPLRFGLLFERFLNPERVSMPDFDIDFCQDRRDEVIQYVQQKYGQDRVAQIITHGKLQARAVLRDVGRVLQMPYGQVDKLCKLVPNNPANPVTLEEAICQEPRLQNASDEQPIVKHLLEIAQKLEGLYRHASTHAAGLVISDRPLSELVPIYRDPKSNFPITQFNWKLVEVAGLVKFDFLGLKTLTVLQKTVQLIKRGRNIEVNLGSLSLDDKPTYELLSNADTVGVFQLESTGMRESLRRLKPDRFEDIIAMVALYRPGPMDNIPSYINRKHGVEAVDYFHPMLENILKETYGVIIYQEQVMQIAQVMGGYSLGKADVLRRAMGKKDKAAMAEQQASFVKGAVTNGVEEKDAVEIFNLVDKFAGYGFNKSHAAAYALISYHTAYLKANFREEFIAASMTLEMGNTDKLSILVAEARKSDISVLSPCVNNSEVDFLAEPSSCDGNRGAIRYSLAALKNIGIGAVDAIVKERKNGGVYDDLSDFARRLEHKLLNRRNLETLAAAGAFESLHTDRAQVYGNTEQILALSNRLASDQANGICDLFCSSGSTLNQPTLDMRIVKRWTPIEHLEKEFDSIGFYLSGHPLDEYKSALNELGIKTWSDFEKLVKHGPKSDRLAGIVVSAREKKSTRGNSFAFVIFSDMTGQFEGVIFSDLLHASRHLLEVGKAIIIGVEAEVEDNSIKMRIKSLEALDTVLSTIQRMLRLEFEQKALADSKGRIILNDMQSYLKPGSGQIRIALTLEEQGRVCELTLRGRYDTGPQARGAFSTLPGLISIEELH
ncbi:MAG: DNA polymerase III subunit alpha [Hyphomicrobiaceae bacterium hypho_1]